MELYVYMERTMSTVLSGREFNHETSRAKQAAKKGPVFITHRGKRSHVLLTIEEYERLVGGSRSIADRLALEGGAEIEFEPEPLKGELFRAADLT